MHTRRIAGFLLGAWMMGSVLLAFIENENLFGVDEILKAPPSEAAKTLQAIGPDQARLLFRFQAAEENRAASEAWEWTQLALGAALLLVTFIGTRANRYAMIFAGGMLVAAIFQRFLVTPEIEWVGRALDFAPAGAAAAQRERLSVVTGAYWAVEILKFLLGLSLAAYLFIYKTRMRTQLDSDAAHMVRSTRR